jgi:hypothetical protein
MDFVYFHVATTDRERAEAARFWEAQRQRVSAEFEVDSEAGLDADSESGFEAGFEAGFEVDWHEGAHDREAGKLMQAHVAMPLLCWDEERLASTLRVLSGSFRTVLAVVWAVLLCVRLRRHARGKKECFV